MNKYFFLSWFYSTKKINSLLREVANDGKVDKDLESLYRFHEKEIDALLKELEGKGVKTITYFCKAFPDFLKLEGSNIWVLSYKGDLGLLDNEFRLSIVGSRRPDPEAVYWINEKMKKLDRSALVISGGAVGVDQIVHKSAHVNQIAGLCVLPVGILKVYPKTLEPILNHIQLKGSVLILSQFHPKKEVSKSSFYPRNELIALLSKKILVIQAALKSGSMVTARYGVEHGREVYTIPASPWDERYSGNLKLIEEGAFQIMDLDLIHI